MAAKQSHRAFKPRVGCAIRLLRRVSIRPKRAGYSTLLATTCIWQFSKRFPNEKSILVFPANSGRSPALRLFAPRHPAPPPRGGLDALYYPCALAPGRIMGDHSTCKTKGTSGWEDNPEDNAVRLYVVGPVPARAVAKLTKVPHFLQGIYFLFIHRSSR
jgi:hypothetical protein